MCELEAKLIAWIDRELDAGATRELELHLESCRDCSAKAAAYREITTAFAAYFERRAVTPKWSRPALAASLAGLGAAAAAITLWMLRPLPVIAPPQPGLAGPAPAIAYMKQPPVPAQVSPVRLPPHSGPAAAPRNAATLDAQPIIEIAIPADAMFAPGAFPTGFAFAADLSIRRDGSPETLRVRPATFLK
jgi:hypothetical protein